VPTTRQPRPGGQVSLRERVRRIAERIVGEHPEAMEILASHDPDADDSRV
jgi:hypothetical protein